MSEELSIEQLQQLENQLYQATLEFLLLNVVKKNLTQEQINSTFTKVESIMVKELDSTIKNNQLESSKPYVMDAMSGVLLKVRERLRAAIDKI
jgi:hypothetical protein